MLHDLVRTAGPTAPLLSLGEAKAQLRVFHGDDDLLIEALVQAATDRLDGPAGILGRALVTQSWDLHLDRFHGGYRHRRFGAFFGPLVAPRVNWRTIELPLAPLIGVGSIAYEDPAGAPQTLDAATYTALDGERAEISLKSGQAWPATLCEPRSVTIGFTCGYGAPADVPEPIRHAARLLVSHWYQNRDAVVGVESRDSSTELPLGVAALLAPYRRLRI